MTSKLRPQCEYIKRSPPDVEITKDVVEAISKRYRTLPIVESEIYEYTLKKHYSLQSNEYLKCHWNEFKKHMESHVSTPANLPSIRDWHFYNCRNRYVPAISIYKKDNFRMKLKTGPGVDSVGIMPTPQDVFMNRSGTQKQKPRKQLKVEAKVGSMEVNETKQPNDSK